MPCASIDGAFHAAESHTAQYAVVPVENSTQGTVTRTMDLLLSTSLVVIGEVSIAVRHNLMNRTGRLEDVEEVCAHPQALAQCRSWLASHLPNAKLVSAASNAEAAVIASKNDRCAAIAASRAAELYGLAILAQSIQDNPHNTTRFWVLGSHSAGRASGLAMEDHFSFLHADHGKVVGGFHKALRFYGHVHGGNAVGNEKRCGKNARLSSCPADGIRYIVDDCAKFVAREIRRGNRYDAIIMDPPSYGRGPGGEMWKIEDDLFDFVRLCSQVLKEDALFVLINSYTTGLQPCVIDNILKLTLGRFKGGTQAYEVCLPTDEGIALPCGCSGLFVGSR